MFLKSKAEITETALYLHCFATAVLKAMPEGTGDTFGIGEDDFIIELYPFAELIQKRTTEAWADGRHSTGVFCYDAMPDLADWFVAAAARIPPPQLNRSMRLSDGLPELDEFDLDLARVIEIHTAC